MTWPDTLAPDQTGITMNRETILEIIIDIGANQGEFTLDVARRNPAVSVLSFEPIPDLLAGIAARVSGEGLGNVVLKQLAADVTERTAQFNVSSRGDYGVSSLLGFDRELISHDEYWKDRADLYTDQVIEVSVVRLDSIPEIQRAKRIRFIKIDAQGVDLAVLESLGEYVSRVEAGMLEVPATLETRLYTGEAHDLHSASARLIELGFRVYSIKPNDHAAREFNLFFCRADIRWQDVESELKLRGIHLYDGKHFWHSPSDHLLLEASAGQYDRLTSRLKVVEEAMARECAETARLNGILSKLPLPLIETANSLHIEQTALGLETVRPRSAFDLRALLTSGAKILWIGKMPPLAHLDVATQILNPRADYRMPPAAHQAYDLVYMVEFDLGRIKAWPMIVDEALRLLRPGGVLVVRMTNTAICSIFALKHQINQWTGLEPLFETNCEDGAIEFAVRNTSSRLRLASANDVSFGVITDGKRRERLFGFLESVKKLARLESHRVELLVCGPPSIEADVRTTFPEVVFVADSGEFAEQGWITRKKNLIVDQASCENIVISHDRYTMDPSFLSALDAFGGDFSVLVCRQLRPDGRRYPDWVTLGADWAWSSPAMMEYGDWNPHIYINGGITIGKTAVLRAVRWNEFLFWNQAEDVELTRRLVGQGHIPRLLRNGIAVSHVTRTGTMEAFEPLPSVPDRYQIPGSAVAKGESVSPSLPYGRAIRFSARRHLEPSTLGLFRCEQWSVAEESIDLPRGVYGELGGRLPSNPTKPLVLTFTLASPSQQLEGLVNDAPFKPKFATPTTFSILVPHQLLTHTKVLRIHLRSPGGPVRLHSLEIAPSEWSVGVPLPVTEESVNRLGSRFAGNSRLDGGSLCLSDLKLLSRGARRIAIFVPDTTNALGVILAFLKALKSHLRPDAQVKIVGKAGEGKLSGELGFGTMPVDWARYEKDEVYLAERNAEFGDFGAELIINTAFPRQPLQDIMIAESQPLGAVGFEKAAYEPSHEYYTAKYTRLIGGSKHAFDAMMDCLGMVRK